MRQEEVREKRVIGTVEDYLAMRANLIATIYLDMCENQEVQNASWISHKNFLCNIHLAKTLKAVSVLVGACPVLVAAFT